MSIISSFLSSFLKLSTGIKGCFGGFSGISPKRYVLEPTGENSKFDIDFESKSSFEIRSASRAFMYSSSFLRFSFSVRNSFELD